MGGHLTGEGGPGGARFALRRLLLPVRVDGEAEQQEGDPGQDGGGHRELSRAPLLIAPFEGVEADVEQAGRELQQRVALAVLVRPGVGGQRLGPLAREAAAGADGVAHGPGEAFLLLGARQVAGVGFAVHDQAEHAPFAAERFEGPDLFVDPPGADGVGRADHDQVAGRGQRAFDPLAEAGGARELLAIAEQREEPRRAGLAVGAGVPATVFGTL